MALALGLTLVMVATPAAWADPIYDYVAVPSSSSVAPNTTVTVELWLYETIHTGEVAVLSPSGGGVLSAGLLLTQLSGDASMTSITPNSVDFQANASNLYFNEPLALTLDPLDPGQPYWINSGPTSVSGTFVALQEFVDSQRFDPLGGTIGTSVSDTVYRLLLGTVDVDAGTTGGTFSLEHYDSANDFLTAATTAPLSVNPASPDITINVDEPSAVPLPPTAWAGLVLFGLVGVQQWRKAHAPKLA